MDLLTLCRNAKQHSHIFENLNDREGDSKFSGHHRKDFAGILAA